MSTILILGGYGATGKLLARHLLTQTDANIILAGRNLDKAQSLVSELNDSRVTCARADASDPATLAASLRGVESSTSLRPSLCLVAAPTTQHTGQVARACLDAGVDYLDVQFAASKIASLRVLEPEIQKAGLCFVTEAGYHPGLPSALVRYAATYFDTLESAIVAGYLNVGDLPYTEAVDELVEAFKNYDARVFKNGAWTKRGGYETRKFDFGAGIGQKYCFSMFFEEMSDLPKMFPSLKETGFYLASVNYLADTLLTPFIMLGLKLFPKRGVRPLGKLLWWEMTKLTKPPYLVHLSADAKGQRNGSPREVKVRIEHEDGYELTAIPVVAALRQYLDGSARKPGLWMMGHLAEPVRLMKDMDAMGAKVEVTESKVSDFGQRM
ncbi:MAG: saccharopine dehydrogenase NADP-binding domain-containing protein [Chloroflexi bacterium]|nr:saccharopine dehydrogenase NADP-binding domain-containing protein [Chloroflexota bacterium]